jgi:hypothetical protein
MITKHVLNRMPFNASQQLAVDPSRWAVIASESVKVQWWYGACMCAGVIEVGLPQCTLYTPRQSRQQLGGSGKMDFLFFIFIFLNKFTRLYTHVNVLQNYTSTAI